MTNFFDFIYELFYIHILDSPNHPEYTLNHEISLLLAYISIFLILIGIMRFFKFIIRLFGVKNG